MEKPPQPTWPRRGPHRTPLPRLRTDGRLRRPAPARPPAFGAPGRAAPGGRLPYPSDPAAADEREDAPGGLDTAKQNQ